ncbi:response regulator transcription factor [Olivibacter sp. SDN3]|uniref:response regulator transcription factor n=1 Tax=Olivibacter sp. SDN3 TaxID=2764720 RepID=UPI0016519424|nr:response regulator transcription factor [Olivibacter sp. SDN3]QNL52074.1 response regulator transcription factor [Olivibacter sp. SDN3]
MKHKLLFVEDEQDLGNVIKQYLAFMGFEVLWCNTAHMAYDAYLNDPNFELLLIDVQLPDYDGFALAEKVIGKNPNQAFLFLTARNEKKDRLQGLRIGADDYINKPFDIDELVLRIKNIIKRHGGTTLDIEATDQPSGIQIGDILFQKELLRLSFADQTEIALTQREAELLEYLYLNKNRILRREDILLNLWGENDYFMGRSLDVFISRLRKATANSSKISIENVYGIGFIFNINNASDTGT